MLTRAQISPEAWQARLRAVIRKGSRYINPRFDVVWAAIAFMCVSPPSLLRPSSLSHRLR